jgi:hypothetical protein
MRCGHAGNARSLSPCSLGSDDSGDDIDYALLIEPRCRLAPALRLDHGIPQRALFRWKSGGPRCPSSQAVAPHPRQGFPGPAP